MSVICNRVCVYCIWEQFGMRLHLKLQKKTSGFETINFISIVSHISYFVRRYPSKLNIEYFEVWTTNYSNYIVIDHYQCRYLRYSVLHLMLSRCRGTSKPCESRDSGPSNPIYLWLALPMTPKMLGFNGLKKKWNIELKSHISKLLHPVQPTKLLSSSLPVSPISGTRSVQHYMYHIKYHLIPKQLQKMWSKTTQSGKHTFLGSALQMAPRMEDDAVDIQNVFYLNLAILNDDDSEWATPEGPAIPGMTSLKDGDLQHSCALANLHRRYRAQSSVRN